METVHIGILGAARIVPSALIKPAQQLAEVVVAGIAAHDIARGRAFAKKHHIPQVFASYDELLTDPIEAVANMRVIDAVYRQAGLQPRAWKEVSLPSATSD